MFRRTLLAHFSLRKCIPDPKKSEMYLARSNKALKVSRIKKSVI